MGAAKSSCWLVQNVASPAQSTGLLRPGQDRWTDRSVITCLRAFSVAFPDHRASCPPHLGLGGAVEDRVLVHSPQVLHDVIWTHNPAHLDQDTVSGVLRARGGLSQSSHCCHLPSGHTYLPTRSTEGFACTADGQGPSPHARKAGCPRPTRTKAKVDKVEGRDPGTSTAS